MELFYKAQTLSSHSWFVLTVFIWAYASTSPDSRWRHAGAYAIPFVVLYGPWWYAHAVLGGGGHVAQGVGESVGQGVSLLGRVVPALRYVAAIWSDVRQWNIIIVPLWVGLVYVLLAKKAWCLSVMVSLGYLSGLFVVILLHGFNWEWQMGVVWNRLTIQWLVVVLPIIVCGLSNACQCAEDGQRACGVHDQKS